MLIFVMMNYVFVDTDEMSDGLANCFNIYTLCVRACVWCGVVWCVCVCVCVCWGGGGGAKSAQLVSLDLVNAGLSPERYWRRPRPQVYWVAGDGGRGAEGTIPNATMSPSE